MKARRPKLLVVDDRDRTIELSHALLRDYDYATRCDLPGPCWECPAREGCTLTHAHDAFELDEAMRLHPDVDVVLLDVVFDIPEGRVLRDGDESLERARRLQGLRILRHLRRSRAELPVVLMTSREELALATDEAREADELVTLAGADAFDARALTMLVETLLARRRELAESGGYAFGASRAMKELRARCLALAPTSLPMLLLGETGTGKTALAERVIHPATGRSGPFVSVDLSALPETLVAAELFGTTKGAYSGAVDRHGLFAEADGGTLLLDEIGNLSLELQRMLLVVLETGKLRRLGETRERTVSVKLVAATNADLDRAVREGRFRADLLARLNPASRLVLPPLRSRVDDLEDLARGFVARTFARGADRSLLARYLEAAGLRDQTPSTSLAIGAAAAPSSGVAFVLSRASFARMKRHAWPGNIRELELFVANATLLSLASALSVEEGRPQRSARTEARLVPIPDRVVTRLLEAGEGSASSNDAVTDPEKTLHGVARTLERAHYERLYEATSGDFVAMAKRLLAGDPEKNARRVRLRFNQLGLRVRKSSR